MSVNDTVVPSFLSVMSGSYFTRLNYRQSAGDNSNFIGTTDTIPFIIKVNNSRALKIEPTATFSQSDFRIFQ
ncbi:MAG: hypothetical protein R3B93_13080 [Bacteroidia bacterium]